MRTPHAVRAAIALVSLAAAAPALAADDTGPSRARYALDLGVAPPGTLNGRARVSFVNAGPRPLARAWFRLWANGPSGCGARAIDVRVLEGGHAEPLRVGCTALPVRLDTPLAPGARGGLTVGFRISAPRANARFGVSGGQARFGNAVPILAAHRDGRPDLDPYIALGDPFFSHTSRWSARVRVPPGWDAATTGHRTGDRRTRSGRHLTVLAPRARDFAIVAGRFRTISATVGGVRVRHLSSPGAPRPRARRMLSAATRSLVAFGRRYGPYRARELEVVDTPGLESEGMEYPGLVLSEASAETVVHEVAHQWWSSQVGSDEWRAPWLDETLTTYAQLRLLGGLDRCDVRAPLAGYGSARLTWTLGRFARAPTDYGAVYDGGACALESLRRAWGSRTIDRMLRRYSDDHMYGVATTRDLVGAIARAAPPGFDGEAFLRRARIDARWPLTRRPAGRATPTRPRPAGGRAR